MPYIPGTAGDDTLNGTTVEDVIEGFAGDDKLFGGADQDTLDGGDGSDLLDGGAHEDSMSGADGDDYYYVDHFADRVIEFATHGYDTVFVSGSIFRPYELPSYDLPTNVERLIALAPDLYRLYGNDLANEIVGNDGANLIYGGIDGAVDLLFGAGGDDTYYVFGEPIDEVIEYADGGNDHIVTRGADYALPDNVEILSGSGASLTGNALNNTISGGFTTAEVIDGAAGADQMVGWGGDDVYVVDNAGDIVIEGPDQVSPEGRVVTGGIDTVFVAALDYILPAYVERGAAQDRSSVQAFDLTGNDLGNELSGNDGANVLDGKLGLDTLMGYGGADTFAFTTVVDGHNADLFLGFEAGVDKVALDDAVFAGLTSGALPAGAFVVGRFATDADDRILYEASTGDLFFDRDGTGPIEAQYFASLADGLSLTASDFIVI